MPRQIVKIFNVNPEVRIKPKGTTVQLPPPIGGLNLRDSLANMDPEDAIELDNFNPGATDVAVRGGSLEHSDTGESTPVESLCAYLSGTTTKMLSFTNGKIFNSSGSGSAGSALSTGNSNDRFQCAMLRNRLHLVNGADTPQDFDGTTIANVTWTGVTGGSATLIGANLFKERLFFWQDNSQSYYFTPTTAAQSGALSEFDLGGFADGELVHMSTWTYDGGSGPDDLAVFCFSSGDTVVYQGTDPGDATKWALVGVYNIGAPVGIRAQTKAAADVIITTNDDYQLLKQALLSSGIGTKSKISSGLREAFEAAPTNFGWDAIIYPRKGQVIFNVPKVDSTFDQHVLNVNTGAWSRWKGLDANAWLLFNGDIYFGNSSGKVIKADTGSDDDGAEIVCVGTPAWNDLGVPTRKHIGNVRTILSSQGQINYSLAVGFDFRPIQVAAPSATSTTIPAWDEELWDTVFWGDEEEINTKWRTSKGSGIHVTSQLKLNALQSIKWLGNDYRLSDGNVL